MGKALHENVYFSFLLLISKFPAYTSWFVQILLQQKVKSVMDSEPGFDSWFDEV